MQISSRATAPGVLVVGIDDGTLQIGLTLAVSDARVIAANLLAACDDAAAMPVPIDAPPEPVAGLVAKGDLFDAPPPGGDLYPPAEVGDEPGGL